MTRFSILALRALLVVGTVGALLAQAWIFPSIAADTAYRNPEVAWLHWPVLLCVVLGLAAIEVAIVAVWVLLSMVERDSVFSPRAFRWVDVIIAAAAIATGLAIAIFALLTYAQVTPPFMVLQLLPLIVVGAAFALLMTVMKELLRKASNLDAELSEVI
ncbi:MAG: DUF2975 domain-containing protein [Propionicimonas sp.]